MAQSMTQGVNNQGVIDQANPSLGLFEFDLSIVSTLTTDLQIELFNAEAAQTEIANSAINNYVPISGVNLSTAGAGGIFAAIKGGTANQYIGGVVMGSNDVYINANAITTTGNTNNVVYFDMNGNLIYQPGFVAGTQVVGNIVVSCTQNGSSYKHIHNWSRNNDFILHSAKMEFSEIKQIQNPLLIVRRNVRGLSETLEQVVVKGAKNNDQFNPLLLTPKIAMRMQPCTGIRYNVSAFTANAAMTVTANLYYSVPNKEQTAMKNKLVIKAAADL
jgi:hypothetical protein